MKMFEGKIGLLPKLALVVVTAYFLFSLPGFFIKARKIAMGRSYLALTKAGMAHEQARPLAYKDGIPNALFATLGTQVALTLLLIITICLMSKMATPQFRKILIRLFICIAITGCFFASLSSTYWGDNLSFPRSLAPAAIVYLVISVFLWAIIGVGFMLGKRSKTRLSA